MPSVELQAEPEPLSHQLLAGGHFDLGHIGPGSNGKPDID
jgi:hypothetical protein